MIGSTALEDQHSMKQSCFQHLCPYENRIYHDTNRGWYYRLQQDLTQNNHCMFQSIVYNQNDSSRKDVVQ